jgi:hypothetical protein
MEQQHPGGGQDDVARPRRRRCVRAGGNGERPYVRIAHSAAGALSVPRPCVTTRGLREAIEVLSRVAQWTARVVLIALVGGAIVIVLFTHVLAPLVFTDYRHNPALASVPKRTHDRSGRDGDPVNVALVGTAAEVHAAFSRAGWAQADSLSRKADMAIAESVLLRRPDSTAPVSSLFLYGRRQDVAFEREVGRSASRRHHVRLWLVQGITDHGRPVWIGDASYDLHSGLSHRTFTPTHHIDPDVDQERDTVLADLAGAGQLVERYDVTGLGPRADAHNASGDRFDTDGELDVGVISPANAVHGPPIVLSDPLLIRLKNEVWAWVHRHL